MQRRKQLTVIYSLIGVVGIVLILVIVWFFGKENRFLKYKDENQGFSIQYPASWEASTKVEGTAVIFLSPSEGALDIFRENVNVVIQDLSKNPVDIKEYSETALKQLESAFDTGFQIVESGEARLAKTPAYHVVYLVKSKDIELKIMHVWTVIGLKAYQLTYTALSNKYDENLGKVEKMINSFAVSL